MNLKNWLTIISIGFEDGPAIMEFVGELNTNPVCIKGIKAIERALHEYHTRNAPPAAVVDYKPEAPASPAELHAIATAIQQHAINTALGGAQAADPQQELTGGPPQAAGNPDAYAPGGSQGASI